MRSPALFRSALAALIVAFAGLSQAHAESGTITLTVYKGGWIIGGSAGGGTLNFRGRNYSLGVGGIDYGLVFGGSKTTFRGRVSNINPASGGAGGYGAARAGPWGGGGAGRPLAPHPKGARPAQALRSAAARAPSCSPTKRARCSSFRATRSA